MKKIFETIVPGWRGDDTLLVFPWHVRVFMSLSVLVAHCFAFAQYGKIFGLLNPEQRLQIIGKLYHHQNASLRSLVQFWKLTAFMTNADK